MPEYKASAGKEGEAAAARYLEKRGYKIVKQNYRTCGVEIDLVARKGDTLCFVEVKTRKTDHFGMPEEFVDQRKRRKIIRGARVFSAGKKYADMWIRFDILSVSYENGRFSVRHIEDAFEEE